MYVTQLRDHAIVPYVRLQLTFGTASDFWRGTVSRVRRRPRGRARFRLMFERCLAGMGTFSNFVAKKLHHFGDKELSVAKTTRM